MKLIARYLKTKDKILLFFILLFTITQVILETNIPEAIGELSNLLQDGGMTYDNVRLKGIQMILYAVTSFAASSVACYLVINVTSQISNTIRIKIYERMLGFSLSDISVFGTGTLISRCNNDIDTIQSFMTESLQSFIRAPILLVVVFVRLSDTKGFWIAMSAVAVALMAALVFFMIMYTGSLIRKVSMAGDKIVDITHEHIYGIRQIHCGNRFESQEKEYDEINHEMVGLDIKIKKVLNLFSPATTMLIYALTVSVYVSGAFLMQKEGLEQQMADFSAIVSYVSFITFLFTALISIALVLQGIPALLNSANRVREVIDQEYSIMDGDFDGEVKEHGTLEFRNVSFAYPGAKADAISDISFKVESGKTVAIIGGTGAGKTTVLNLALRLYDAGSGEIFIDGVPVKDYKLNALRNLIGYVPQQNYLFTGTIADNIGYGENGRLRATLEEIEKAARVGQAEEFIRQKREGYNETVLAGGTNFSGGQRQRLTISRAVCRDPEIFIFDDSFSALDFETDAKLRNALRKTTEGATVIIVGQRISSIKDSDLIIVMDSGRIVGKGSHEQLLQSCKEYKEIVQSQSPEEKAV